MAIIKTKTIWGRDRNEAEKELVKSKIKELTDAGLTDGVHANLRDDPGTEVVVRTWISEEAADNWIAFQYASISPPPLESIVEVI
jgi:hypothetical protein